MRSWRVAALCAAAVFASAGQAAAAIIQVNWDGLFSSVVFPTDQPPSCCFAIGTGSPRSDPAPPGWSQQVFSSGGYASVFDFIYDTDLGQVQSGTWTGLGLTKDLALTSVTELPGLRGFSFVGSDFNLEMDWPGFSSGAPTSLTAPYSAGYFFPSIDGGSSHYNDGSFTAGSAYIHSASITLLSAPVPEPAIWAMMIIGFGGVGGLLRRARRTAFA